MNQVMLAKIILYGIPILVLLLGGGALAFMITRTIKDGRKAKFTTSGLLFRHPDHGGGQKLFLYDEHLQRPELRPFWYRPGRLSPQVPFYFFEEVRIEEKTSVLPTLPQTFDCICGYHAKDGRPLRAHIMYTPKGKGKGITRDEWCKLHSRVPQSQAELVEISVVPPKYEIRPYDVDAVGPVVTPFAVFDLNEWECQKDYLTVKHKWQNALNMGVGVVMAISCLVLIIVLIDELGKDKTVTVMQPRADAMGVVR